jgi:capsular polysaccharide transport system permease protein
MGAEQFQMSARPGATDQRVSLFRALVVQVRIVRALTIREVLARYGGENLGFFWVIGEPMTLTFGVMVLWTFTRMSHAGSVSVLLMALTGYTHVQLWRYTVLGACLSIRRSAWLSYHPNVQTLDVLMARSFMLGVGILGSFMIGYLILYLADAATPMRDPLLVAVAWCLDVVFCFAVGLVVAGISEFSGIVEKLVHPLMYITLPLTGIFTFNAWLPPKVRAVMEWSPLVNICEMFRAGVFPESVKTTWYPWYVVVCSLVLIAIGLPLLAYVKRNVEVH